jgi:hypothetical protein
MLPAGDGTVDATAREAASWIAGAQDLRLGAHAGRRIAGALIAGRAGASWIAEQLDAGTLITTELIEPDECFLCASGCIWYHDYLSTYRISVVSSVHSRVLAAALVPAQ